MSEQLRPQRRLHTRQPGIHQEIHPLKRYGQHFLKDRRILQKLVDAGGVGPGDVVLEVGPGLGDLTRALLKASAEVVAVEVDHQLAERLETNLRGENKLHIASGDFLSASPEQWLTSAGLGGQPYKVVANLPYYITSAILRHLLEAARPPSIIVVTVQREVAQQITAKPGQMSLLAVSVQFYGEPRIASIVPSGAFFPRPQVDSAIVAIEVRQPRLFPQVDAGRFFEIIRAGFSTRRKQLRNSLALRLEIEPTQISAMLAGAGIDPRRRAETLSLEDWRRIYDAFQTARIEASGS